MNAKDALVSQDAFARLREYILAHTGLHYYADKPQDFAERIARRMRRLEIGDCGTYFDLLRVADGAREVDALTNELTIGETYFFRHAEQFDALRELIIPDILERNAAKRRLHVWSAGCATGSEPYSISILLKTHFEAALSGWDVRIIATDINSQFLAEAQAGEYTDAAFRATI